MASKKTRSRQHRRDRRKAKQNPNRLLKTNSTKIGHGGSSPKSRKQPQGVNRKHKGKNPMKETELAVQLFDYWPIDNL